MNQIKSLNLYVHVYIIQIKLKPGEWNTSVPLKRNKNINYKQICCR